jgi:hypothetical protein
MEFNSDEPGVVSFNTLGDLGVGSKDDTTSAPDLTDLGKVLEGQIKTETANPLFDDLEELGGDGQDSPKGEEEEGSEEGKEGGDIFGTEPKPEGEVKLEITSEPEESKFYKSVIKELWGDEFDTIIQEGEDGEEVEVKLEEIEMTAEVFKDIYASQLEAMKEKLTANKISAEGISDFTKNLIEIDKRGGNITELLQMKQQVLDPLEGLDLDEVDHQKYAVALYYNLQGTRSEKEIDILIKGYEAEGTLEDLARQATEVLKEDVKKRVEQEKQIAIESEAKRKELMKSYKKDLRVNLDRFELKDPIKSKIVDLATKVNQNGKFDIDLKYGEIRRDPERMAELALYLLDREEFIKQVSNKEVQKSKLDAGKKLRMIKRSPGEAEIAGNPSNKPRKDNVVLFDDLIK